MAPRCSICDSPFGYNEKFAQSYPGLVCQLCDERAVNKENNKARYIGDYDDGDNPVFIDGIKCWRRYRFGFYVTMRDYHDCKGLSEFYEKHFSR